jgi:RNA polymerase sigma factor (sigma-70 family)
MDRELLAGFRAGKRAALERIYWEHIEGIELLLQAGLRRHQHFTPANLADLVQDVFSKAFTAKARAAYDGEREYGPFLRQIARNTLVDWLRQQGREVASTDDLELAAEHQALRSDADAGVFSAELVAITQRFVSELDPSLRAVHERRFLAGESQERAAETLGISRQSLRTLERRLLEGLRREIRLTDGAGDALAFPQPNSRAKPY